MPLITNLTPTERPRERCLEHGPECLSLRECIAVILGTGPAKKGCMGLANNLFQDDDEDTFFRRIESFSEFSISGIKGLGPAGKSRVLASIELARRYARFKQSQTSDIVCKSDLPREVQKNVFEQLGHGLVEQLGFVPLYPDHSIGSFQIVQKGDECQVPFRKQHFLRLILYSKAEAFWMFHNHPDHSHAISQEDRSCTREIRALSRLLGIHCLGHWIVAGKEFIKI